MPDVALAAATATLFYSLFLFPGYQKFFRDSDAGWHIRNGERIIRSGELPKRDPFSFTMASKPWFAWEWGSDVLVGTIHSRWGLSGVAFFYGCAIAAGVWCWFRLNWLCGGNFLFACFLAAPMLSTSNLHWLARPHVLSWIFLIGTLMAAETLRERRLSTGFGAAIAAGSCLWTNLHASFFFAPVIFGCYAAGTYLEPFIWKSEKPGNWRAYAVAGVISAAASLVNPYGWGVHEHVFRYLTDSELLQRIGEFQTFNFGADGTLQILLALGVSVLACAVALSQRNLPAFLLSGLLIVTAIRTARGLPLLALLVLPLANGVLTKALRTCSGLQPSIRRALDSFLAYSGRLRVLDSRSSGLVWVPVIALIVLAGLRSPAIAAQTGFPADQFPVAAAGQVEAMVPGDARILAPDKFGGYLIYRFDGARKVFFDGRSDLYGAEFLKQYGRMVQVRPGWKQIFEQYRFTHALLPDDYSLIPALQQAGWKTVYRDQVCTLLSRD